MLQTWERFLKHCLLQLYVKFAREKLKNDDQNLNEFYREIWIWAGMVGAVAFRPQGPQFVPGSAEIWTDLSDFLSRLS